LSLAIALYFLLNLKLLEGLPYWQAVRAESPIDAAALRLSIGSGDNDMTTASENPSIACTLAPGDFRDRLAWIADLTRNALRGYERHDLTLVLRYVPEAADRVEEMVRREKACCSFLTFVVCQHPDEIRLTIKAPEEARVAADMLFEQFVASAEGQPACGCEKTLQPLHAAPGTAARDPGEHSTMKAAGVAAVTLTGGAVACGACCVLPFAVPVVALAGAGSMLALLAGAHAWVTGVAAVAVAGAWIWIWWQSARSRARPAASTLYLMSIASALLVVALLWPYIEPHILRALVA
jgi:hypothetical protein